MMKKRDGEEFSGGVILMLLASCRITDVSEGERKELSYAIVKPGDFPPEIDQILRKKKNPRSRWRTRAGTISTYAATESRKRRLFHRSKKYRNRKTPFRADKLVGPAARRSRKAPPALRRAENESGGGNLSRI